MMNPTQAELSFIVPLSFEAHRIAEQHRQQQNSPRRAKQAYLNSLAVYAVDYYLRCMGWETDRQSSDRHLLRLKFVDAADLIVTGLGHLECRPVLPGQTTCEIPPETWEDRIGYVAVQFSPTLRQAEILGFVPTPAPVISLNQLRSLDDFLLHLDRLKPATELIRLSQWLEDVFSSGWQAVETLMPQAELAVAFRNSPNTVRRCRSISLGSEQPAVLAVMTLALNSEQQIAEQQNSEQQIDIQLEVQPAEGQAFLPPGLEVAVLDDQGSAFLYAQTRDDNPPVQLDFSGEVGDAFSIRIALGKACIIENFLI